ncbi:MAG: SBBP repeat-containing protein [Bacteroidota bacterium]
MRILFVILLCLLLITPVASKSIIKTQEAKEWLKNQPLSFIENKGQFTDTDGNSADNVLFKASYGNCDIYITTRGLSYVYIKYEKDSNKKGCAINPKTQEKENRLASCYRFDMDLVGASIDKGQIIKEKANQQGYYNYFYASCPKGICGVQEYGKITIKNIYKGIDWVIYTSTGSKDHPLKYDFVVHPQANYKDIKIKFVHAQSTSLIDNNSKLKVETIAGTIEEGNVSSYFANNTGIGGIQSKYVLNSDSLIEFEIANYDKSKTIVIDPLVWATYYGGSSIELTTTICCDSQDNIYISGGTSSADFPTQQLSGAYWQPILKGGNVVLIKFNKEGVRQWATYYGGDNSDFCESICADSQGNIYITGETSSPDFPIKQINGAYCQTTYAGGLEDIFIARFNSLGQLQWSTFYGGNLDDWGLSIIADNQDNIYVTGSTFSLNFSCQQLAGAYWQDTNKGRDAFILKFNSQCERLWASFYGGIGTQSIGESLCTDTQNNIYITGHTYSNNFPVQQLAGAYWQEYNGGEADAFILKFNNQGIRLWATYYGGIYEDDGESISADKYDNIYITGYTNSFNFPVQQAPGSYWQPNNAGDADIIILKFNNLGAREWATYYGGYYVETGISLCIDDQENVFVTGATSSYDFPTQQKSGEYWEGSLTNLQEAYLLEFNKQGDRQWATYYGNESRPRGTACVVDSRNSVYFTGIITDSSAYTIDYGNGAYYDNSWNGGDDIYVLKVKSCFNQKIISAQSNRNNICPYDNGNIMLTAIGGLGDTLKWYSGGCGLNYIGENTPLTIPSPTQTTTYFARWESLCDTSACDSITITIVPSINIKYNPDICFGATITVGTHTYATAGLYSDTLTTLSGCDSIITTKLTINPKHQIILSPQICQGETYQVGTHIYTTTGTYLDNLLTVFGCDSLITTNLTVSNKLYSTINPSICQGEHFILGAHTYTSPGIYIDTLTTKSGCDSIITTNLTVNVKPIIFLGNDTIICPGNLINLSVGPGFRKYLWSDGTTFSKMDVSKSGTYSVEVFDGLCYTSDTILVKDCNSELWFPSAFSPNYDGKNETFNPVIQGAVFSYHIQIFNRWGQKIYESYDVKNGWDGTINGNPCYGETYAYIVNYTMKADLYPAKEKVKRGAITVLR